MARPKKAEKPAPVPTSPGVMLTLTPGTTPGATPDAAPEDELTQEQSAEIQTLDDKFNGIPGDTSVEIYRYQEDGDLGFCGRIPAHTFSEIEVARRWHTAGKYRAIARVKDKKTGYVVPGGNRTKVFTIDEIAAAEGRPVFATPGVPVPAGAAGEGLQLANGMASLLATVTTAMGSMITAMSTRPQAESSLDQLDKLAGVIEKLAPKGESAPDKELASRMVGMMNDVLDLKERVTAPAGDVDPMWAIARENLPRVLLILENAVKRNNDPDAARLLAAMKAKQAALPPGTAPAAVDTPLAATTEHPMWWLTFAKRLPFFVSLAKKDKDPVLFAMAEAELIEGTDVVGPLKQFLAADDVVEKLVGFAPELGDFRPWVTVFVSQLQESLGLVPEGTTEARFAEPPETAPAGPVEDEPTEENTRPDVGAGGLKWTH